MQNKVFFFCKIIIVEKNEIKIIFIYQSVLFSIYMYYNFTATVANLYCYGFSVLNDECPFTLKIVFSCNKDKPSLFCLIGWLFFVDLMQRTYTPKCVGSLLPGNFTMRNFLTKSRKIGFYSGISKWSFMTRR